MISIEPSLAFLLMDWTIESFDIPGINEALINILLSLTSNLEYS